MAIIINIVVMVMTRMTRTMVMMVPRRLTYGLGVLSRRIGVVVVITGGDVRVGVSPFVLDACSGRMTSVLVSVTSTRFIIRFIIFVYISSY